jgi:hypothetical protein
MLTYCSSVRKVLADLLSSTLATSWFSANMLKVVYINNM